MPAEDKTTLAEHLPPIRRLQGEAILLTGFEEPSAKDTEVTRLIAFMAEAEPTTLL